MSAFISQYSITFPFSHFLYISSSPLIIHVLLLYHKHTQTHNRHTQCMHTTYHTPHTISHTPHTTQYNDTHHTPHIHSTHLHTLLPVAVIKILWKSNSRKNRSIWFTVQGYSAPWWRSWQQELESSQEEESDGCSQVAYFLLFVHPRVPPTEWCHLPWGLPAPVILTH